jgi:serine/threonine protein kinase
MTTQQQEEPIQKRELNPKPKQPKSPIPPPKDKILINLKSLGEASTKFQEVLEKCNNKDYGKAVTASDIFSKAILKLSESDLKALQRASITTDLDLLKFEWSKDQDKEVEKVGFNSWLLKKLKLKTNHKEMQ